MYSAWANHLITQELAAKSQQEKSSDSTGGGNEGDSCLPALNDGEKEESQVLIPKPVPTTPEGGGVRCQALRWWGILGVRWGKRGMRKMDRDGTGGSEE